MSPGERYGRFIVREVLCATDADHVGDGAWCWVRCDCGMRLLLRARHLRYRVRLNKKYGVSCGCALPEWKRRAMARSAEARRTCG